MVASMHYCRRADLDTSEAGDRAIVYDPDSGAATILNPTGSLLWGCLAEPSTEDELVAAVKSRFAGVEDAVARRDVFNFLGSLKTAALVVSAEASRR